MKWLNHALKHFFHAAELIEKRSIAAQTFHLKLRLHDHAFQPYVPGQHLSFLTALDDTSPLEKPTRCYSVWHYDREKQEIDIAACTYSNGSGTAWLHQLRVSDTVYFKGPEGKLIYLPDFEHYFFFGDTSALGHLYHLRRQVGAGSTVGGLFWGADKSHFFADLDGSWPFLITTDHDPVREVKYFLHHQSFASQKTMIYIAGEADFCAAISRHCRVELGLNHKQIKAKPFWHPRKKGLE